MSLSEFFDMGGYATFVWSSYALAMAVLVLNVWLPWRQHQQNVRKLKRLHRQKKAPT